MSKIKVSILKGQCMSCGTCFAAYPEVFEMDVDGKAKIKDELINIEIEDPVLIEKAKSAASMCPNGAIKIEEIQ